MITISVTIFICSKLIFMVLRVHKLNNLVAKNELLFNPYGKKLFRQLNRTVIESSKTYINRRCMELTNYKRGHQMKLC